MIEPLSKKTTYSQFHHVVGMKINYVFLRCRKFRIPLSGTQIFERENYFFASCPCEWEFIREEDGYLYYSYKGDALPHAVVCVLADDNELSVVNILPMEKSMLSFDEYNELMRIFVRQCVRLEYRKRLTAAQISYQKLLNPTTRNALEQFSYLANHVTKGKHPMDQERWVNFVTTSYRTGSYRHLIEGPLSHLLEHAFGWPHEDADMLSRDFDRLISFLSIYHPSAWEHRKNHK